MQPIFLILFIHAVTCFRGGRTDIPVPAERDNRSILVVECLPVAPGRHCTLEAATGSL